MRGRDVVKGYRKWYGVSTACAIIELRQLGVKIDEQRLIQARRTEESTARQRAKKKQERTDKLAAEEISGLFHENFAYIAGYTNWGFPYGVTWEELEAEDDPFYLLMWFRYDGKSLFQLGL